MNPSQYSLNPPQKRRGFSLVEVMVGLTLMAMVFTGVFAVFRQSLQLIESARDYTRVAQILQSEIEGMRLLTWVEIQSQPVWTNFEPQGKFVQAYIDRYTCYKYVFNRNADQKEAILICFWTDNNDRSHYQVARTFFTRDGLNDYYYRSF